MLPIQKLLINANYSKGAVITPKYIIIHESGNPDKGANAIANRNYFANHPEAQASAHFCVDDHSIVQCLELNQRGWHIGVIYGHPVNNPLATNSNTVGIEICVNVDDDFSKARTNAIDLTKYLMNLLHISASNVIRHYDACLKDCPQKMLATPSLWTDFKKRIATNTPVSDTPVGPQFNFTMLANIENIGLKSSSGTNSCSIGTIGKSLRLEMISINCSDNLNLEYSIHEQSLGDTDFMPKGSTVGTVGVAKRIEGIIIKPISIPRGYKLQYRGNIQNQGMTAWQESGTFLGTKGKGLRLEYVELRVIKA